jgi:MFS family permease
MLASIGSTVSTIFADYALSFAVDDHGLDKTTMLWVAIVTNLVALVAIPLWAMLADRVGRKPVLVGGALVSGALMFAYLAAIASETYVLIFAAAIAMSGIAYSAFNGVQPALYGEMFPTRVRLSGMALGTQIGYAIGGFAPTAAAAIDGAGWMPVALYVSGSCLIAAVAALTARETCRHRLEDIDGRPSRVSRDDAVLAQAVEEREERPLGVAEA